MIKITIDEFKQICNLSIEDKDDFIKSKFLIIDELVRANTNHSAYEQVIGGVAYELMEQAFKTGFSYFLYAECIDFLNTDTLGDGIVRSTGYLDNKKEMISFEEMEQRRNKLELKAYSILQPYLNEKGQKRYNELRSWDDMARSGGKAIQMQETTGSRVARI